MTSIAGSALLWVVAAAVIVLTYFVARLLRQLGRTAAEVEKLAQGVSNDLLPRVERVLDRVEAELVEVQAVTETARRVTERTDRMAATLGEIVARAQETVNPILDTVADLGATLHQGVALFSGLKAGLGALRRFRGHGGE